jgi:hypothetical protein
MTAAQQAARRRGIASGTEVCGDLGRPDIDFTGRVVEIYAVVMQGFEVPAVKVETADGSVRYQLLGSVTLARGEDDAAEPRTPAEFAALLGDVEAEATARRSAFMSCPRQCGTDIRNHHSSGKVNGGCDTGPMSLEDMSAWFEARGAGQPDFYTVAQMIKEHYGKTEDDLEALNDAIHGSMA